MKFHSPKYKRLRVIGAGQFVDGLLETDDEAAISRIRKVADRYGIKAITDSTDPFDPAKHDRDAVNAYLATANEEERTRVLELEVAGKARSTVLRGPHGLGLKSDDEGDDGGNDAGDGDTPPPAPEG